MAVKDSGVGIPEEQIKDVFTRYKKYGTTTHNKEGMGLGLAIVKKIVDLHQSDIQLVSKLNEGSTFSFNLSPKV